MDTTTTIISSSYEILRVHSIKRWRQSTIASIYSLNSLFKMFYDVSFVSSSISLFLAIIIYHYHRFNYNTKSMIAPD